MYDVINEKVYSNYESSYNLPVVKICPNLSDPTIKNGNLKLNICSTPKCTKDEDCLSGKCSSETCIKGEKIIYMCSGQRPSYFLRCGKVAGMSAVSVELDSNDKVLIFVIVIIIMIGTAACMLLSIAAYFGIKKCKDKYECWKYDRERKKYEIKKKKKEK
ncbi:hypothetical protein PIROE2DRAFT_17849 [Piromyces sp. E2]|nr:hypothetical protein PIROE2DRAFT_17849 [Piromyces sp. E2]|eukprot:OUM57227.1 hypothetical protein PIROE2DRAFT_17849 [Piromyces sp. E2]